MKIKLQEKLARQISGWLDDSVSEASQRTFPLFRFYGVQSGLVRAEKYLENRNVCAALLEYATARVPVTVAGTDLDSPDGAILKAIHTFTLRGWRYPIEQMLALATALGFKPEDTNES